jgi:hypothetical protein
MPQICKYSPITSVELEASGPHYQLDKFIQTKSSNFIITIYRRVRRAHFFWISPMKINLVT